jgi:vacuolar-type H+-ATPase subunit I/STV1
MNATGNIRWVRAALLVGVLYLVTGLVFAALAKSAASNQVRVAWRLAAWVISAAAFAAHIGYEQVRLRSSPRTTALHASLAVALGAFGLAVAASLHAQAVHRHFPAFALAVWPVLTALPAFVVALVAAAVLTRARRSA